MESCEVGVEVGYIFLADFTVVFMCRNKTESLTFLGPLLPLETRLGGKHCKVRGIARRSLPYSRVKAEA